MAFEPVKKQKVAEQVADAIRDAILRGVYEPGDSLPSERNLADQFAVNRSSVREALHRLDAWGLIEMRHGGATRVRDFLVSAGLNLLPQLLMPGGTLDHDMLVDLLEVRVMLLRWTATQATLRRTDAQVEKLRGVLERLEAADDPHEVQRRDFEFYEQLVEMAGNRVLSMVSYATRRVYMEHAGLFVHMFTPELFDSSYHRSAYEAVRDGHHNLAGDAMEAYGRIAMGGL